MSANVDKAQQVRPPIAVYAYQVDAGIVIPLPGVPADIGGSPPGGSHGLLLNFLTIQNASVGGPNDKALKYYLNGDPTTGFAAGPNTNAFPDPPPSPITGQYAILPPGETVRFDLSNLYDHTVPGRVPVQYLHVESVDVAFPVDMRFWRSSGR
jgi:hypothetical protein